MSSESPASAIRLEPIEAPSDLAVLEYRPTPLLQWLDEGTVLLADQDAGQLVIHSLDGSADRRIGRKGTGPEDFMSPVSSARSPNGRVVVADGPPMRLAWLGPDRRVEGTVRLDGMPLHVLSATEESAWVVWLQAGSGPSVGLVDLATGETRDVWHPFTVAPEVQSPATGGQALSPFIAVAQAGDGRFYVGSGKEYRLAQVRDGVQAGTIARDLPPEPFPEEDLEHLDRQMGQIVGSGAGMAQAREQILAEYRKQPRPYFKMIGLATDSGNRLWVVTERGSGDSSHIDVFDPDGTYRTTVTVPHRVRRLSIDGDRVAVLVQRRGGDHDGMDGVDLYRILP